MKNKPLHSLNEVNDALLGKLYDQICEADDTAVLVALSGAVAKLNASAKGSEYFSAPDDEAHQIEDEQMDAFGEALEGDIV